LKESGLKGLLRAEKTLFFLSSSIVTVLLRQADKRSRVFLQYSTDLDLPTQEYTFPPNMFLNLLVIAIGVNGDGDVNQRPTELADVLERCWQYCLLQQGAKCLPCKGPWPGASVQASGLSLGAVLCRLLAFLWGLGGIKEKPCL